MIVQISTYGSIVARWVFFETIGAVKNYIFSHWRRPGCSAPAQCLQCQALFMKMGRWVSGSLQRGQCRNLGALGMMISCGAGCVETAMTPLGAGPTPAPEVGSPISRCAISPGQTVLQKGISTAGRGHRPLDFHWNSLLFVVLLRKR